MLISPSKLLIVLLHILNTNLLTGFIFCPQAERLKQEGRLLEIVDQRLGSHYSQEEALRMLNVALLCTNTSPVQRPRMSSVVSMLCGQAPLEVVPDEDLSGYIRPSYSQSNQSMNNSLTEWSYVPSSDPSILLQNSMESGYLPSSSSPSSKLWAAAPGLARMKCWQLFWAQCSNCTYAYAFALSVIPCSLAFCQLSSAFSSMAYDNWYQWCIAMMIYSSQGDWKQILESDAADVMVHMNWASSQGTTWVSCLLALVIMYLVNAMYN